MKASKNFEEDFKRLQRIVEELGSGKLTLAEALKKYEEGIKLAQQCSNLLKEAQQKVQILMRKDAKFSLQEFNDKDIKKEA